jgi:hypothetical protein
MRVSELIHKLEQLQEKHGDKPVFTFGRDDEDGTFLQELQENAVEPITYRDGEETGVYGIGIYN